MGLELQLVIAAFVAGILTILAPCVLPVLPIIVGSSASGAKNKLKPLIITGSLMASVIFFTLLLRASTTFIGVPTWIWPTIAGVLLVIFGIFTIFPQWWDAISLKLGFSSKSNKWLASSSKKGGLYGDALVGLALGPVFTSCSPTFGVIIGIVLGGELAAGTLYLLVYSIGLGIMLLAIAYAGQALVAKLGWATNPHGWFRRVVGIMFIVIGILLITGFEKSIETWLLEGGIYDWVINIESRLNS